jgi:hypothetical protein
MDTTKKPTSFRIGQLVSERGTTHRGHIECSGPHPEEWVIRLLSGEHLTCLEANLIAEREGAVAQKSG